MSTRGWYEYHVLDEQNTSRALSMQFYKWGDAVPINALAEWNFLKKKLQENAGRLPIEHLNKMLREQLNELFESLPSHFSLAAFLFILQRAKEEQSPLRRIYFNELPIEQHPDFQLRLTIAEAMAKNGFEPSHYEDSLLNDVVRFIAVGRFIRPWKYYGLTWSVLNWLQYLTQVTSKVEMGSIAGDLYMPRGDIQFIYRFFIWINTTDTLKVDRFAIELCDNRGRNLLYIEDDQEEKEELKEMVQRLDADTYSLAQAEKDFVMIDDHFWGSQCYERL